MGKIPIGMICPSSQATPAWQLGWVARSSSLARCDQSFVSTVPYRVRQDGRCFPATSHVQACAMAAAMRTRLVIGHAPQPGWPLSPALRLASWTGLYWTGLYCVVRMTAATQARWRPQLGLVSARCQQADALCTVYCVVVWYGARSPWATSTVP